MRDTLTAEPTVDPRSLSESSTLSVAGHDDVTARGTERLLPVRLRLMGARGPRVEVEIVR